jgi:alpha-tubulin suppressor-like RCC1 family protein
MDGHVSCWGSNIVGELGNGTTADLPVTAPVTVNDIDTAIAISAGFAVTCALLSDGTVRCWGLNLSGQLGNGSASGPQLCGAEGQEVACATAPVPVVGISTARAISTGGNHTCALLAGGALRCWGLNTRGQLGNGNQDFCRDMISCSATPLPVGGITTATTISAAGSGQHTCATLDDGTARCWGRNDFGQLGNTTVGDFLPTPLAVSGVTGATAIAAGFQHSCAHVADGSLTCWGQNALGQLGRGTSGGTSSTPAPVNSISTATAISAGVHFNGALLSNGTLRCWGSNSSGQLGNGTIAPASAPVPVSRIFDAIAAVVWNSLDPSVASIGAEGVAAGIDPGTTVISAAAVNFGVSGGTTLAVPEPGPALGMAAALGTLARVATRARRASGPVRRAS